MKVLVTGASGFVGYAVWQRLHGMSGIEAVAGVRCPDTFIHSDAGRGAAIIRKFDLTIPADWPAALGGVDAVVHAAARVHVMQDMASDPLAEYRRINVHGTLRLARQAAVAGIKRFVFLSSVKVNGESTQPRLAFTEADAPNPKDAYGQSKCEAEQGLRQLAAETGMEVVIIRPPLVYGVGVRGNFEILGRAVQRGWPLPLGWVHNQRSLVALDNLVDFIVTGISHSQAANQTFLVSDGRDLSTIDLVTRLAQALGVPLRLVPVPVWALQAGAALLGKKEIAQRVCSNLQVNISKAHDILGWVPPIPVDEGLRRAAAGMKKS